MLRKENKQMNILSMLYSKIPEDHILKRISAAVDFSFINDLVKDSYCENNGRPAKSPELLLKLILLEYLYDYSDVQVIEQANYNLAFLWFLDLNPDDTLPDPSLLAKFRTQRLKDVTADEIISEIIKQCLDKGLIKGTGLTVDATHIEANCKKKIPERIMGDLAKRIIKALKKDCGEIPEGIDTEIPDYTVIEDHQESKETMKSYLEKLIDEAAPFAGESTNIAVDEAKEVLSDEKFLQQKGIRSLVDKDARVGNKSKTQQFYGFKAEYTMMADERIITAVDVKSGEAVDGDNFGDLLKRTQESGIRVSEAYGDKAYFRKDILELLRKKGIKDYIPVSAQVYRIDEEMFSYNKDSDTWQCRMGNETVKCKRCTQRKRDRKNVLTFLRYTFAKEGCINCPHREECMGKQKTRARTLEVGTSAALYYEKSQEQKTPEFIEKYKKRSSQEWKNGEMKRFHGMARARGWGLRSMTLQVKLTSIAVNLKRIAALVGGKNLKYSFKIRIFSYKNMFNLNNYETG